ncbi:MAG: hypothetical protein ACK452_05455 [Bacteroidota bacterium]|jgi:hypothetical protein
MKNTKTYLISVIIGLITSCSQAPEKYEEGLKNLNEKNWEQALDCFNQITTENNEWLDSANLQKSRVLQDVIAAEQWEKLVKIVGKNDASLKPVAKMNLISFFENNVKKNGSIKAINILDNNKSILDTLLDSITKKKIMTKIEDNYFLGVWKGSKEADGCDIVFERKDNQLSGNSTVNFGFWKKNDVIFKNLNYENGQEWNMEQRIFRYNKNTGDMVTIYYEKNGKIKIISSDSIYTESKVSKAYFIRKKP